MHFKFRVDHILFSGAEEPVAVGDSDLIVLIGPNNAGKSAALRELVQHLRNEDPGVVIKEAKTIREGDEDEFDAWLLEVARLVPRSPHIAGWNAEMEYGNTKMRWADERLQNLTDFLVLLVNAEARLSLAGSVESFDPRSNAPRNPLQRLLVDPDAEARLSAGVQTAYGSPVSVNRAGGTAIHLHLGRAASEPRFDNKAYMDEISELPLVSEQGDGVRSFIGVLLALEAAPYPVVLVDEPEAFLHPPQAREIGRQLGSTSGGQRFVATHDSDVLLGLLDRAQSPVIIRLRRERDVNVPSVLRPDQVRVLWQDPSFRYSRLLDGLFHRGAVVCEADGDATLYAAALDAELDSQNEPASDFLFTQCGGKHKMPAAIEALKPMGVPVVALADLDALRDEGLATAIVHALGGNWSDYAGQWQTVKSAIESIAVEAAPIADVSQEIGTVLGEDGTARLTEEQSRRIRDITRRVDGWKQVKKRGGLAGVPHGEARAAADDLLRRLRQIGLFLVPVGELEGWGPDIGKHGPEFVDSALTQELHRTSMDLRAFVRGAAEFLAR